MDETYESTVLTYTIHKYSSYSSKCVPENILVNKPSDQLSRWFTDNIAASQFIILKLESPVIVQTIKFGKFIKPHVSDLKKFQVYGGTDDTNMSLLLTAGLKKDNNPETFRLRHKTIEGLQLPVQYIKIVPLQSWGPAYNYTIWYIELHGKNHPELMDTVMDTINMRKEEEAVRLLLKHLRRRRYKDAFEALSRESGVQLEGALQARLWNALVESGDYKQAERILDECHAEGEFDWYMSWLPYSPSWRLMSPCSAGVEERLQANEGGALCASSRQHDTCDRDLRPDSVEVQIIGDDALDREIMCEGSTCCNKPGPRGGHQLVVDSTTGTLYLFGGWNGTTDLDDLWSFDTDAERWSLLCAHSSAVGGPSPRSCHKMVFDPVHRKLYTLGRYLDSAQRLPSNMNSDLYSYSVECNTWSLIISDTACAGGPRLVFDHQMCMDHRAQVIYVFGGRVLPHNTEEAASPQYSGLYAYYVPTNTWQLLLPDKHELPAPQPRVSHSMLFHPLQGRLYIFAGQRNKEHMVDVWWWEPGAGRGAALCSAAALPPPAAGFTQRATIDPDTDEMFVLSGMSKEKDKRVYNTLWVFSLRHLTWTCVYRNDSVAPTEPRPRFAHQLVYDPVKKIHYLFGGNPGAQACPRLRLDDLWSLRLRRASLPQVVSSARVALREACYRELIARGRDSHALHYLQTELHDALDHTDPEQVCHFQKLATALFKCEREPRGAVGGLRPPRTRTLARRRAAASRRAPSELALVLAAVLGADENFSEPNQPYEEVSEPTPETWDVGQEGDEPPSGEWDARAARTTLYDHLCRYFRPSVVPPRADIADLVAL